MCRSASSRCLAAYLYAAAGEGESSTDLAWDGQTMIYENGVLLAQTDRFPAGPRRSVADLDLDLLSAERRRMGTFDDNRRHHAGRTDGPTGGSGSPSTHRTATSACAVPSSGSPSCRGRTRVEQGCYEAYNIQVSGLEQRLRASGNPRW